MEKREGYEGRKGGGWREEREGRREEGGRGGERLDPLVELKRG